MKNDHIVHTLKFDLTQLSQVKHQKIEDRVSRIFNQSFYSIINRLSTKFAGEQDILIDSLQLDLGSINQENLERELPYLFEQALNNYLENWKTLNTELRENEESSRLHPLIFYLFQGVFPWYASQGIEFIPAWRAQVKSNLFVKELYQHDWPSRAIKRLVQIGFESLLKDTLKALVPSESSFILSYHEELLSKYESKELLRSESKRSFHLIIWEFTLQYVLRAKGSRFSRKLFITAQLESLAIHYNLKLAVLFQLFYEGIEDLSKRQSSYNELYSILLELSNDFKKDGSLKNKALDEEAQIVQYAYYTIEEVEKMLSTSVTDSEQNTKLKQWLSRFENIEVIKNRWLAPLKEQLLYRSLRVMIGKNDEQLVKEYHELLWTKQEQLQVNSTAVSYKKAVWVFTLTFFQTSFSSYFQATVFVEYHIKKIAQFYQINYRLFLKTLILAISEKETNRTKVSLLYFILFHMNELEVEDERAEEEGRHKKPVDLFLIRLIQEYESITFTSEKETYFFLEEWALQLMRKFGSASDLPISYLLSVLKNNTFVPVEFYNTVETYQQFEDSFVSAVRLKNEVSGLSTNRIVNLKEEWEVYQYVINKKPLTYELLVRLLQHEKQLSAAIVKKLKSDLDSVKYQVLLIKEWIIKISPTQYISLVNLLSSDSLFFMEVFNLTDFTIKNQTQKIRVLFIAILIEKRSPLISVNFWKSQLTSLAKEFKMSPSELKQKLINSALKLSLSDSNYISHYLLLTEIKYFLNSKSESSFSKINWKNSIIRLLKLTKEEVQFLTDQQKVEWNDFLLFVLMEQPVYLMKHYFNDATFKLMWETHKQWISLNTQRLYSVRQLQWEKISRLIPLQELTNKRIDRLIQAIIHQEENRTTQVFNFSTWEEKEVQYFYAYLLEKKVANKWVYRQKAIKESLLEVSKSQIGNFFIGYYKQLEAIYKELPSAQKPYSYYEFELIFWEAIALAVFQKLSVWEIFEKWSLLVANRLNINITQYGKVDQQFSAKYQNKIVQLQQKLQKYAADKEPIEEAVEEKKKKRETEEENSFSLDKWEMQHVGLVILHPFIKQLFLSLDYLNGQFQFKTKLVRSSGVRMLYYLATGLKYEEDSEAEHELAFPKILCGMDVSDVIDLNNEIEVADYEKADSLLEACITHWDKLSTSSPDSLRNTFLKRQGRIVKKDAAFQLYVESSGTDILLDYLPWSITMIHFAWIEVPIYISWR
jgi:hypothetical protein